MKVAVYSGSFNPLHKGHISLARYLLEKAGFDRVLLVVSPHNPFKDSALETSARIRLDAAARKVASLGLSDRIIVDDIEFSLGTPSYTIRTLDALKARSEDDDFTLAIGADILHELPLWREGERIMKEYGVVVYPRSGYDMAADLKKLGTGKGYRITLLNGAPAVDISSTQIREGSAEAF